MHQTIGGHDGEVVFDGLTDEHAVEWVGVEGGKLGEVADSNFLERERLDSVVRALMRNVRRRQVGQAETTEPMF